MKCILCNNKTKLSNGYKYCNKCMLVQKEHVVNQVKEKDRYMQHNNKCEDVVYQNYFLKHLKKVLCNIKQDDYILDFGSGVEPVLQYTLNQKGFKNVYIYDIFFAPSTEYLNYKYDVIFVIEVIEHIEDIKNLMNQLISLLNDKGIIIIKTELFTDHESVEDWWYVRDETHISFFNEKTFEQLAIMWDLTLEYVDKLMILRKR